MDSGFRGISEEFLHFKRGRNCSTCIYALMFRVPPSLQHTIYTLHIQSNTKTYQQTHLTCDYGLDTEFR